MGDGVLTGAGRRRWRDGGGAGPWRGRCCSGCGITGPGRPGPCGRRWTRPAPRVVLIEGPPEADALIPLAADEDMRPPVALLAHAVDEPGRVGVLAAGRVLPGVGGDPLGPGARRPGPLHRPARRALAGHGGGTGPRTPASGRGRRGRRGAGARTPTGCGRCRVRVDPLGVLAETAGYDDPERWWEDVVEHRGGGRGGRARAVRRRWPRPWGRCGRRTGRRTRPGPVREAHMRLQLRAARREFGDGVAVVCGAWHVPALRQKSTVAADRALLKGLPKVKADDHLGALDAPPAVPAQRIRRGHRLARLVRPPVRRAGPARRALDDQGRAAAAGRGPARVLGARHRGGTARRDARRDARAPAARADARRPTPCGR